MTHTCPCCGHATPTPTAVETALDSLTPLRRAIVRRLARDMGRYVPTPVLVDAAWGADPNGGPEYPSANVAQLVRALNAKLAGHGLAIESKPGCGYRLRSAA